MTKQGTRRDPDGARTRARGRRSVFSAGPPTWTTVSATTRHIFPILAGPLILTVALSVRTLHDDLAGLRFSRLGPWPGTVTFGYYFALLVLALRCLTEKRNHRLSIIGLLLLVIALDAADLVLTNIVEAGSRIDSSYGPIILWDVATFFVWLHAISVSTDDNEERFGRSLTVLVAPMMKVGREIIEIGSISLSRATSVDFLFGDLLLTGTWAAWWMSRNSATQGISERRSRWEGIAAAIVLTTCLYWFFEACWNLHEILNLRAHERVVSRLRWDEVQINYESLLTAFLLVTILYVSFRKTRERFARATAEIDKHTFPAHGVGLYRKGP